MEEAEFKEPWPNHRFEGVFAQCYIGDARFFCPVKGPFSALHARVFCHATENLEKVRSALLNVVGDAPVKTTATEGHHGNRITILEAVLNDPESISLFFSRLEKGAIEEIARTLDDRTDNGCNIFIRLDKQSAYGGSFSLGAGDDVVSVRLKAKAFPSRPDVAIAATRSFLAEELARRDRPNSSPEARYPL
jgi:RNA binding exosome subunit